jgi:3-oxoacyl-[acyl-carrier-protein] synthase II
MSAESTTPMSRSAPPRVAVTGMSAWSCFGRGVAALLGALRANGRGVRPVERFATDSPWIRSRVAATAPDIEPSIDPWAQAVDIAVEVAAEAAAEARIDPSPAGRRRIAVVNGTMHSSEGQVEFARQRLSGKAPDPQLLAESAAGTARRIARRIGAGGPNVTVSTACSSGLNAIGQAARLVQGGQVEHAIAGGNDLVSVLPFLGFNALAALSPDGCRPLDLDRDGITLGDGAAYLAIEREETALRRGARILGFVAGYAFAGEGYHPTAADPEGACAVRVMSSALGEDQAPSELALVLAHATGTPAGDAAEVRAIQEVVRRLAVTGPVDVCAMKSHVGHTLGAAGALAAVAALACMAEGLVPGTAALVRPVPHEPPLRLRAEPAARRCPLSLCNAFGFGGSVAALALRASTSLGTDGHEP